MLLSLTGITACVLAQCASHSLVVSIRHASDAAAMLAGMKLLVRWFLLAAALLLVAHVYPGVEVKSFGAAMVAALVLGLLNALLRPLLVLLTLPVTLLTLGLFLFVINALMFYAAAYLLDNFNVSGFAAALIGSLIYSLCGMVIDVAMERLFSGRA
jgi:putative membrane protein